jgi:hypothetical protein
VRRPVAALGRRSLADALAPVLALALAFTAACGGGGRDVVQESRDVVADGGTSGQAPEGYEYVARRPLAVVALAEGRGLDPATAHAAIEHLADRLDACVTDQGHAGAPVDGAARVVARIDATGNVAATQVRIDPGASGASSAVLCLVAPLKLLTFPPGEGDNRGLAIEAIWGRVLPSTPAP